MLTRDCDIRPLLRKRLEILYGDDAFTRIVDELPICVARARADVAVINGELVGFEIKSDADRLSRMAAQAQRYGEVFDRANVVSAPRHLEVLRRRLPTWWGLWVVGVRNGNLDLEVVRAAGRNPAPNLHSRIALLRRDEMAEAYERLTGRTARGAGRAALVAALVDVLDVATAGAEASRALRSRVA